MVFLFEWELLFVWDSVEILTWDFSKLSGNFYLILESLDNPQNHRIFQQSNQKFKRFILKLFIQANK
jgi:hypothetical protein